jgi:uncharacterized lipoprotein YddW (UPF0748 family)
MERLFRKIFFFLISIIFCAQVMAQDVYAPYMPEGNEVVFNQSTYPISVIDPQASTNASGANYPGLRGANQLVIYTPAFGFRTNTNEFGTEAVITGDTVTSLSGADSLIPANGLVISGHGRAKKWINENVMVGSKIYVDVEKQIITSYITSDTFLYGAREKVKEVENMMFYYPSNDSYTRRKTEQNLNRAKEYIYRAQRDSGYSQKYASKAIEYADNAMATVIPYNPNEFKGVWIRPTYHSMDEIISVLDRIAEAGINNIFIETYYHGQTIFPSRTMEEYGFIVQNPEYAGFDPLRIWITEAHRRGIKVHIWFESFYVGNKPPETNPRYILAVKPEWANYQKKNYASENIPYSVSEHNGYFIDPANPDVQAFLYNLIDEIILRYRPDGINLDYIRYPQSLAPNYSNYDMSNWGYTKYAREEFEKMYGVDPVELGVNDYLWYQWKTYRAGKVTDFVRRVGRLARMNGIMTTAVIFPNIQMAYDTKLQDWKSWSMNNYIDGFTPLLLTCDDKTAMNLMGNVLRNKSASTKLYAGLFVTFMNGSNSDLIKQIHAARKYDLNGLIIFDYAHLKDSYVEMLTQSVFRPTAITIRGTRRGRR